MDKEEFRKAGYQMIDYIVDYQESLRDRPVLPQIEPGYMKKLIPRDMPEVGESYDKIMADVEEIIMPGVTHWQSPRFHAYFPTGCSYPSMLADMLCRSIACIGFSWISGPSCTELETHVMDWLAKLLDLPRQFLSVSESGQDQCGGGVIQGSASEAILCCMLAAKKRASEKLMSERNISRNEAEALLVGYCSDQAHSSVEKGFLIAGLEFRKLESDANACLQAPVLLQEIKEDREKGLVPIFVCSTAGTTTSCAIDDHVGIGKISKDYGMWMHIDAAYAGSACICPEYRDTINGVEFADSFNFNPHKWLLVNFDCSALFVKDRNALINAFSIDPEYLKNHASDSGMVTDYRNWQIPLGRTFRSLKLWFVMRAYGKKGLQDYVRTHCRLAQLFKEKIEADGRFEVVAPVKFGLVCFRLEGADDETNKELLDSIVREGQIFMIHSSLKGRIILRFVVCAREANEEDVEFAFQILKRHVDSMRPKGVSAR
eukprot:Nk52_evm95s1444 gene=Nk52_evmTU95s1444